MFLNVCKQTFPISHVGTSQKVKGVLMWSHIILFSYEGEDTGRFSNLHKCTFNKARETPKEKIGARNATVEYKCFSWVCRKYDRTDLSQF